MDAETLARFARLAVAFGANVQPGQIVSIGGSPGKDELVRAIAAEAYRSGAKFDMRAVTDAARDASAFVIWDLSHSAGALALDLNGSGAELAVG